MLPSPRPFVSGALVVVLMVSSTALFLLVHAVDAHAATNLVRNPGLETGDLAGWNCEAGSGVIHSLVHSGSEAFVEPPEHASVAAAFQDCLR